MTLSKWSDAPEQADKQTERQTDLEIVALKSGASSRILFFLAAADGNSNGQRQPSLKPNSHIPPDLHLLARVRECEASVSRSETATEFEFETKVLRFMARNRSHTQTEGSRRLD